jgi:hypothetical protein
MPQHVHAGTEIEVFDLGTKTTRRVIAAAEPKWEGGASTLGGYWYVSLRSDARTYSTWNRFALRWEVGHNL